MAGFPGTKIQIEPLLLVVILAVLLFSIAVLSRSSKPAPCSAPEYHQFDFWAGDWDVFDHDNPNTVVARARVDRILNGCVLREDYLDITGHRGQSFSIYDSSRNLWHQTWVTDRGELLVIEGKFQNSEMVLSGMDHRKSELAKGTWTPVKKGVREIGVTSIDNGKTGKPWFDLIFRPHKP